MMELKRLKWDQLPPDTDEIMPTHNTKVLNMEKWPIIYGELIRVKGELIHIKVVLVKCRVFRLFEVVNLST